MAEDSFNPRTHEGYDESEEKFTRDMRALIPVPTKGTINPCCIRWSCSGALIPVPTKGTIWNLRKLKLTSFQL